MYLRRGDLIQYNLNYWANSDELADWVVGLVLGTDFTDSYSKHVIRVFWFDDHQETEEPNPQEDGAYKMFSPGSSVG